MEKIEFSLLAESASIKMSIQSESIDQFMRDFMLTFVKEGDVDRGNQKVKITSEQQNNAKLRANVEFLIEKYESTNKKIYQLRTYLSKLNDGEYFLIIPCTGIDIPIDYLTDCYKHLESLNTKTDYEEINRQFTELFEDFLKLYEISSVDETTKQPIGEKDKTKRICRFCKGSFPEVTFKNTSHAISEALGNKSIILNDECDQCNSSFGKPKGIEESLINYLKYIGHFHKIKGKNGQPTFKGENFELRDDSIILKDFDGIELPDEFKYRLKTYDTIVKQDMYRTLCKYALSTIKSEQLLPFSRTIDWINHQNSLQQLPKVAVLINGNLYTAHPKLGVYLRKDSDISIPYAVGEFRYTVMTIVFIIPLADKDDLEFIVENEYDRFWDVFTHFNSIPGWAFTDLSDKERRKLVVNINLDINPSQEYANEEDQTSDTEIQ